LCFLLVEKIQNNLIAYNTKNGKKKYKRMRKAKAAPRKKKPPYAPRKLTRNTYRRQSKNEKSAGGKTAKKRLIRNPGVSRRYAFVRFGGGARGKARRHGARVRYIDNGRRLIDD
jgi:hypothetical protein